MAAVVAPLAVTSPAAAAPGDITTIAGGGVGDGGPATSAMLASPLGVAVDGAGNVYIADDHNFRVRKVDTTGVITTIAGTGARAYSGDGGPATAATFIDPIAVAVDSLGRVYVADSARIRRIDTDGIITTYAGGGGGDPGADNVAATSASFIGPQGLAFDPSGNLLIADQSFVSRVDGAGIIHVVAGGGTPEDGLGDGGPATSAQINNPPGIAVNATGDIFISDGSQRIRRIDHATAIITTVAGDGNFGFAGDGGPATGAEFAAPAGLAVDAAGGVLIADKFNHRVRRIDPNGIIDTVAGDGNEGSSGDGGPATAAQLVIPYGLAADAAGNYWVLDAGASVVRRVDSSGIIHAFAGGGIGDGGPADSARLVLPAGVRSVGGSLLVTTRNSGDPSGNRVRRVDPSGVISTFAGGGTPADGLGDYGPATAAALNNPLGIATTATGDNTYIADCGNNRVRKVNAQGTIKTVAGGGPKANGVGDGHKATAAGLQCPTGLLLVTAGTSPPVGTLFITDCDANRVRRVGTDGIITTVAGTGTAGFNGDGLAPTATQLSCPSDLAFDATGALLVADRNNNRVRRVDLAGTVSTVAGNGTNGYGGDGGAATATPVNNPTGVAVDATGRLVIAENTHARLRRVDTSGVISTLAGTGVPGFSGDGGPATLATLAGPTQVTFDAAGNVVFTDSGNWRVRMVQAGSTPPPATGCGSVITKNTTLTADIGPCPADGLVIGADHITLNLGGHTVSGPGPGAGNGGHVGIRMAQSHGVTVGRGTVTGFDAGLALVGGSANTLSHLTVRGNVAPVSTPSGFENSEFGDGVVLMFSGGNRIVDNVIDGNGIYDNIGLLGLATDDNTIEDNQVANAVGDGRQGSPVIGLGIAVSPFLDLNLPARGNSLHGNDLLGNTVSGNYTTGISMLSNQDGVVAHNTVTGNGLANPSPGNGIGIRSTQLADPLTRVLVSANNVHGNAGNGIQVTSHANRIVDNDASNNALANGTDLNDQSFYREPYFHQDCTDNVWRRNIWGSGGFNQRCVTIGGHAAAVAAAVASPSAAAGTDSGVAQEDGTVPQRHLSEPNLAIARASGAG